MDQNPEVVNPEVPVTTVQELPVVTPEVVVTPVDPPGSKTESALLLKSLQEERDKRKELERQLETINNTSPSPGSEYSDEGLALKEEIRALNTKIESLEDERAFERVQAQFPAIKDVAAEFNEYRKGFPRHKLENVVKLFLSEKGLLEPTRIGLEQPTGGARVPIAPGMTAEDVADLRKNNFKKYQEMLHRGDIKFS